MLNVMRGHELRVSFVNTIGSMPSYPAGGARHLMDPPISPPPMNLGDQIPQWGTMNFSAGVVTHLHGGKVGHDSDGWPLDPASFVNNPFQFPMQRTYHYPNDQRAAMLWFHDHGMDNTAVQVHAGLAGVYFVRDQSDADIFHLIGSEEQELPLVIQDRLLTADEEHFDYLSGLPHSVDGSGNITGFDRPEYLGETIFVNGRPNPHTHVHNQVYRLRLLNGSNARSYALALAEPGGANGGKIWHSDLFTVIGNDGGLFAEPYALQATDYLVIAPGERLDVLVDFTGFDPTNAPPFILYNLALKGLRDKSPTDPEPIFQTDDESVLKPTSATSDANIRDSHNNLLGFPQLKVMQFKFAQMPPMFPPAPLDAAARANLAAILGCYANGDGFVWDESDKRMKRDYAAGSIARNRFVLLMNDTQTYQDNEATLHNILTNGPWRDTQIWELRPSNRPEWDPKAFTIPFDAHLNLLSRGHAASPKAYEVSRAWFFEPEDGQTHVPKSGDPMWSLITENPHGAPPVYKYGRIYQHNPGLGRLVAKPGAGTFERWYVANIGNAQPQDGALPDMHPFHLHLVNFVVLRRWTLEDPANTGAFEYKLRDGVEAPEHPLNFDRICRHDTVRVHANELVELLVYFPPGYRGKYPYHCHLVEHEDMGMMLHFEVE